MKKKFAQTPYLIHIFRAVSHDSFSTQLKSRTIARREETDGSKVTFEWCCWSSKISNYGQVTLRNFCDLRRTNVAITDNVIMWLILEQTRTHC